MKEEVEGLIRAVSHATQTISEVARSTLLPPAEEGGALIADSLRARRLARLPKLLGKVEVAWQARGVRPAVLPDSFAAAWVHAATLESDPDLQDRWSALLANAADPAADVSLGVAFIELLRQLTPAEAALLEWLKESEDKRSSVQRGTEGHLQGLSPHSEVFTGASRAEVLGRFPALQGEFLDTIAVNLDRLGLATTGHYVASTRLGRSHTEDRVYGSAFALTPLGRSLVIACRFDPNDGPTAL